MTLVFINDQYDHIKCNLCDTKAPPAKEVLSAGGITGLGWFVAGGIHRCPKHYDVPCPPEQPIRLEE